MSRPLTEINGADGDADRHSKYALRTYASSIRSGLKNELSSPFSIEKYATLRTASPAPASIAGSAVTTSGSPVDSSPGPSDARYRRIDKDQDLLPHVHHNLLMSEHLAAQLRYEGLEPRGRIINDWAT
jgi:hypothetical protein